MLDAKIKQCLDAAETALSDDDYQDYLEAIEEEVQSRLAALDEDEADEDDDSDDEGED